MAVANDKKLPAMAGLLSGAVVWGMIWYPYRLLEEAGVSGVLSTFLSYSVVLLLGLVLLGPGWRGAWRGGTMLLWIGLAYGWTNLAYVLAVVHGEVMRVLLLFYLAPLWTVGFARWLLGERLTGLGYVIVGLSLAGATVMLWHPDTGLPLPRNGAEWLGLSAGLMFALGNVLSRRAADLDVRLKSLSIWLLSSLLALLPLLAGSDGLGAVAGLRGEDWLLVTGIGAALFAITLTVQYGLARVMASHAAVIFLFELVVAAMTSWWWVGELLTPREWLGGAMIALASLFSGRLEEPS
jgi:drug/metabolite transporter (DMT)-like permease